MKKKELITLGAIIAIFFTACYNPFFPAKRDSGADPEAPHISSHPQSAVYKIGIQAEALTVTASIGDGGTLSYQWYSNASNSSEGGTPISGATGTSYALLTDQLGTVYYYVTVTNSLNGKTTAAASRTARIEVNDKENAAVPHISVQPQSAEYAIGDAVAALTIIASVNDLGTLSYQWHRNTLDDNVNGTLIPGATGESYMPPTGQSGTFYYYVTVTNTINDNGDGGNKSAIQVSVPVSITVVNGALWARTVSGGSSTSRFRAVAVDASGNVYAAGSQGNSAVTYGSGVSATGAYSGGNVLLVKYNSGGTAQWAQTVSAGSSGSTFSAVAVDSSGNVYAAGYHSGKGAYNYGDGVSVTGPTSGIGNTVVLVKYDSSGTAKWAQTVSTGSNYSQFEAVAVDASGNVYAAGEQSGTDVYTYGNGVTATGTSNSNVVLVKYNSSGTAQWARTVSAVSGYSWFFAVAVDASGNVYAAGYQRGNSAYTYGSGVSATGTNSAAGESGENVVLVKYDSSGTAQWARTVSAGNNRSRFNAVAVDASGSVYAVGNQYGTGANTYGSGVSATGTYSDGSNVLLVKYDSGGTAQWARTVSAGNGGSYFYAVAVNASGNVYAAGEQSGAHTYGSGVSATTSSMNVVLVKYDSGGTAQWARTVSAGSSSAFEAVAVDASGSVYAAGNQYGTNTYTYGSGVSATGAYSGNNVVVVKYRQ